MLKKILAGLAALVALFVIVVATRPSEFRVSRSTTIAAPPAVVFAQVNDLHQWGAWDPWAKIDPDAKTTFDGPSAGVGASMAWDGNKDVGKGRMTITESKPAEHIALRLDFEKPMKSTCDAKFTFKAEGGGTAVTWVMAGRNDFLGKAFSLFMDCDKLIGGDFEKGLAQLKSQAEAAPKP